MSTHKECKYERIIKKGNVKKKSGRGQNVYKYEESTDNNQSLLRLSPSRSLLILSSTMSIFNLFSIKHTFSGKIKTKPARKFAFFSLNTNQVKYDLNPTLKQIIDKKRKMQPKTTGFLQICRS